MLNCVQFLFFFLKLYLVACMVAKKKRLEMYKLSMLSECILGCESKVRILLIN